MLVSELSGRSNIIALTAKHNLQHDNDADGQDPARRSSRLENHGYQFEAAEASFDLLVQRAAGTFQPHFELLHYHVNVETDGDGRHDDRSHGQAPRRRRSAARSGRGRRPGERPGRRPAKGAEWPLSRTSAACSWSITRSASSTPTPAPPPRVRVVIESRDDDDVWGTVGVSENIIEASWIALVDSIEYKLFKDEQS